MIVEDQVTQRFDAAGEMTWVGVMGGCHGWVSWVGAKLNT